MVFPESSSATGFIRRMRPSLSTKILPSDIAIRSRSARSRSLTRRRLSPVTVAVLSGHGPVDGLLDGLENIRVKGRALRRSTTASSMSNWMKDSKGIPDKPTRVFPRSAPPGQAPPRLVRREPEAARRWRRPPESRSICRR